LSRYAFDALLSIQAEQRGAQILRESDEPAQIVATGRAPAANIAAHVYSDSRRTLKVQPMMQVELYFFGRCYVGVNAIEGCRTTSAVLRPRLPREFNFDYDAVVRHSPALADRLAR
jgi:hypothetical protein